ncbi:MAG: hypothetical protein U0798_14080 [Gemmataceae bacterium]
MNRLFLCLKLCFILSLGFFAPGCRTVGMDTGFNVRVIDAETKLPLPDATVQLSEAQYNDVAREIDSKTEKTGIARFRELPGESDCVLTVAANQYLPHITTLYEAKNAAISNSTFASDPMLPANKRIVQVELFAAPRPTIELVVPNGFRGLIQADLQIDPTQISSSQMRRFRYDLDQNGHATVTGPPVLQCVLPADFIAISSDGTPMPVPKLPFDVGLRIVAKTDAADYFVIGTELECAQAKKKLANVIESRGGSKKGRAGSRGHRN